MQTKFMTQTKDTSSLVLVFVLIFGRRFFLLCFSTAFASTLDIAAPSVRNSL